MSDGFRDWIPAGEDTGAIGDGGYQDYVPPAEPKPQAIEEEPKPEAPAQEPASEQPKEESTVPPLEPVTNQDIKQQSQGQSLVDKLNPFKKEEGGQK